MSQSTQIDTFSRFTQVSRETITSLVKYENYLIKSNKTLNLIGKSTINEIWLRHFLDSSQVIDFIRYFSYLIKLVIVSRETCVNLQNVSIWVDLSIYALLSL